VREDTLATLNKVNLVTTLVVRSNRTSITAFFHSGSATRKLVRNGLLGSAVSVPTSRLLVTNRSIDDKRVSRTNPCWADVTGP
jgi:hypothetical protein